MTKLSVSILSVLIVILVFLEARIVLQNLSLFASLKNSLSSPEILLITTAESETKFDEMVVREKKEPQRFSSQRNWEVNDFVPQALSVLAHDLDEERVLFEKNVDLSLPIASLTKIMAVFLVKENEARLGEWLKFSREDLAVEGNKSIFRAGEEFKLEDLLAIALLASSNEATALLARSLEEVIEGEQGGDFFLLMNAKAEELGLKNTHFSNPIGFDGDNFSSSWDLFKLTEAVLGYDSDFFASSFLLERTIISREGRVCLVLNTNSLLGELSGISGSKTGYTDLAKGCMLLIKNFGDHNVLLIILGTSNREQEMKRLIDWVEEAYDF